MKIITKETFEAVTKRNRESVAKKLDAFLTAEIVKLKKNDIVEISATDFLKDSTDFHYYSVLKLMRSKYADKLETKFILKEHGRADKLMIKVK